MEAKVFEAYAKLGKVFVAYPKETYVLVAYVKLGKVFVAYEYPTSPRVEVADQRVEVPVERRTDPREPRADTLSFNPPDMES